LLRLELQSKQIALLFAFQNKRAKSLILRPAKKKSRVYDPTSLFGFPNNEGRPQSFNRWLVTLNQFAPPVPLALTIIARLNSLPLPSLTPRVPANPPLIAILYS
jgi:hypothetical protein